MKASPLASPFALGALACLKTLDEAVYRTIITNPAHGLTKDEFAKVLDAHADTLAFLRVAANDAPAAQADMFA